MKTSIILSTLLAASFAFAQGQPAATPAAEKKALSYKEAKAECHKEAKAQNKALKGAELQKCIQNKKTM